MSQYDAFIVADANIDLVAHVDDTFISDHPFLQKGVFVKCLEEQATYFLKNFSFKAFPGGTGANVAHTMRVLGGNPHYLNILGEDAEGLVFKEAYDLIQLDYKILKSRKPSTKIFTFITPDGERTGASFYGASTELSKEHIDKYFPENSQFTYLDGYMLNQGHGYENLSELVRLSKEKGSKTVFAVNSTYIYSLHKDKAQKLIDMADILVFSEDEAQLVTGHKDIDADTLSVFDPDKLVIVTLGKRGSLALHQGKETRIDALEPRDAIIDLNGAGDNYLGGFLYGLSQGYDYKVCGDIGAACATECIIQNGPRIRGLTQTSLDKIVG